MKKNLLRLLGISSILIGSLCLSACPPSKDDSKKNLSSKEEITESSGNYSFGSFGVIENYYRKGYGFNLDRKCAYNGGISTGDFDGDGDLDLACLGYKGRIVLIENKMPKKDSGASNTTENPNQNNANDYQGF